MMRLDRVTITGADDRTNIKELLDLSDKYPFVEWAILASAKNAGGPRWPSQSWMEVFTEAAVNTKAMVSLHLCGSYVRGLLLGNVSFGAVPVLAAAQRIQINTHAEVHQSTRKMHDALKSRTQQWIFQLDGINDHLFASEFSWGNNVAGLFDMSHGAGVLPDSWPDPVEGKYCGYAGGLGPDNVFDQVVKIERATDGLKTGAYWIDMERRVRSDDDSVLDMDKVRNVLKTCAPLIR